MSVVKFVSPAFFLLKKEIYLITFNFLVNDKIRKSLKTKFKI